MIRRRRIEKMGGGGYGWNGGGVPCFFSKLKLKKKKNIFIFFQKFLGEFHKIPSTSSTTSTFLIKV
jgi:hypothetical protein